METLTNNETISVMAREADEADIAAMALAMQESEAWPAVFGAGAARRLAEAAHAARKASRKRRMEELFARIRAADFPEEA